MSATWNDPDSQYDSYVVHPEDSKEIYYTSEMRTIFGSIGGAKEISSQQIAFSKDKAINIDVGSSSPVWTKGNFDAGTGECRLTMVEPINGMPTYGEADPKPGEFGNYKHGVCYVRQVDSPIQPIMGFESQQNIKKVIPDIVKISKSLLMDWRKREIDLDGFRACFMGVSRGLLITEDGGKGITLEGGSAGQARAPYNTYVAGQTALTTPSAVLTTHNTNLYNALGNLGDDKSFQFDYESHLFNSYLLDQIGGEDQNVEYNGRECRAIALIDERNMYRMMSDEKLATIFKDATVRSDKNKALYTRDPIILDDIYYIPVRQMRFFRPNLNVATSAIVWGADMTKDPRRKSFINTSSICPTIYLRRGALLRGRRKGVWFSAENTDKSTTHKKSASYCMHYHDGWTRMDWFAKDGRSEMMNDTMLVTFHYDKGVGTAYNA